jgi:CBS domain-containing membrane protein
MTADVLVVRPDDPITRVHDLMGDKHIRHVPVVDEGGDVVGLVSERDLLRRSLGEESDLPLSVRLDVLTEVKVSDVMTWQVDTVEADQDVAAAASIMLENKYGCLPVVEEGTLIGILTESDFVRFVADQASRFVTGPASGRGANAR